jgi:Beta-propeller repeat
VPPKCGEFYHPHVGIATLRTGKLHFLGFAGLITLIWGNGLELMSFRRCLFVPLLLGFVSPLFAQPARTQYLTPPLVFEPNQGQASSSVRFLSRANGHSLLLSDTDAVLRFADPAFSVRMKLIGQNPRPRVEGVGALEGVTNYLIGNDPQQWRRAVPHFAKVRYGDVYPGVDLLYYGSDRQLEYDFEFSPYTNPSVVQIEFQGAEHIVVDPDGDLVLQTLHGEIRHHRPVAFQKRGEATEPVEAQFRLRGNRVGFEIGAYDRRLPLVIDPKLVWSSYIGGPGADQVNDIAVEPGGDVYVTGVTQAIEAEPAGLLNPPAGQGFEVFVTKIASAGSVVYTTYFGGAGSGIDEGHSIAVDASGRAYVTGYTTSTDFPIVNGFQKNFAGAQDAYLVRLSSGGDMIEFSSYLGGSSSDRGYGIAVDAMGNAFIAGSTFSSQNFPTLNAFQSKFGGGRGDAFLTKISATGTIAFSTFLGGTGDDQAFDCILDSGGNIILTGFTTSNNQGTNAVPFPTLNAIIPTWHGGDDVFITKFDPSGRNLVFSTYWGGSDADDGVRLAVDRDNYIYVTGYTKSLNFPLKSPAQLFPNGGYDAFLIKLQPDGKDAVFSTYIGGEDTDGGVGVAVDNNGFVYLTGFTSSLQFYAINAIPGGGGFLHGLQDAFVMKLWPDLSSVVFSSYLGGFGTDGGTSIGLDAAGNIYVGGFTTSIDFPIAGNNLQGFTAGMQEGFLAKINVDDVKTSAPFSFPTAGGVQVSTAGQSSNPIFGYVAADVATGLSPTGLEILDLRAGGVLLNEVSIPVPAFTETGRVFASTLASDTTALTMVNPNDTELEIGFYFTQKTGGTNFFGTAFKLPAHAQVSGLVTAPPFNLPSEQTGTLTFQTDVGPVSAVAFRVMGSGASSANVYLPIMNPYLVNDHSVVVPQIVDGGGWNTQFYLINLTENTVTGEIRLSKNDQPGEPGVPMEIQTDQGTNSVFSYSIEPRALYTLTGNGAASDLTTGFAEIVPSPGSFAPLAYGTLVWTDSAFAASTVEAVEPKSEFRMYAEASGNYPEALGATPSLALANSSDSPATVNLKLFGLDGTDSGLSAQVTLQPKGHLSKFLYEIPGFENLPSTFFGVLRATTSQPGVTFTGFRTRHNENGHFLATITGPLKDMGNANPVIFPHLVDGGGYATQFILIDATGSGTTGTFRYLNPSGNPLNIAIAP